VSVEPSVTYRFRFSADFLIESMLKHRAQLWWRRPFKGSQWLLGAVLIGLFVLCVAASLYWPSLIFAALAGAIVGGWPINKWFVRWRFRKSPFHDEEVQFVMSEGGVHVTGRTSDSRVAWSAFTKARRFKDGLLLFQGPDFFNWLPDSAAADGPDVELACTLVRRHVKDYRDV
jgi:hypothetical protein